MSVRSVSNFEVVGTHLGLQQVHLGDHTIDVNVHDGFGELLVT